MAVCLVSVFIPAHLLADGFVHVPSRISPDAAFVTNADENESYQAVGADGAQAVIGEAAVVTAVIGSRFSLGTVEDPLCCSIELEQGLFRIHVGSKPVILVLDDCSIAIRQAELFAARLENGWLFQLNSVFSDSKDHAEERHIEVSSVRHVDGSTGLELYPACLSGSTPAPGKTIRLEPEVGFAASPETDKELLKQVALRLMSQRSGPMLKPVEIEDVKDLGSRQASEDGNLAEIEIDPIEIEPSCIEICVD